MCSLRYAVWWLTAVLVLLNAYPVCSQQKNYEIYGQLTYPDGRPAPGVHIIFIDGSPDILDVITDSDGEYRATIVSNGAGVFAEAGEYALSFMWTFPDSNLSPIKQDFRLENTTYVYGEVTDAFSGEPIADTEVGLECASQTKTGQDGVFRARVIRRPVTWLSIWKPGYVYKQFDYNSLDSSSLTFHIKLTPGVTVKGKIVDRNGKPVAELQISTEREISTSSDYVPSWNAVTDMDGRYEMLNVDPTKPLRLRIYNNDIPYSVVKTLEFQKMSKITTADYVVDLKGKGRRDIAGRVTDEKGNAIEGAEIRSGRYSISLHETINTKTDAQGYYKFNSFVLEQQMILVQADGFAPAFLDADEEGDQKIDVILKKANSARIHVVDTSGKSLEGVEITVRAASPVVSRLDRKRVYDRSIYHDLYVTKTDNNGEADLKNLPADDVTVGITKPYYCASYNIPIRINSPKNLIKMQGVSQFAGTVVDTETGMPVCNFRLKSLNFKHGGWGSLNTVPFNYSEGKFIYRAYGMSQGPVVLQIKADGYIGHQKIVSPTEYPKVDYSTIFALEKTFSVSGQVVDNQGHGVADAKVIVLDDWAYRYANHKWYASDNPDIQIFTTGPDGSFTIDPVVIGKGTVFVIKQGYPKTAKSGVDLTKPVQIILPEGSKLTVEAARYVSKDSTVTWKYQKDGSSEKLPLSKDRQVVFPDMRAGRYTVTAGTDLNRMTQDIDLKPGKDFILDFDKKAKVRARIVFTRKGIPVPDVRVHIRCEDGSSEMHTTSDSHGVCHIATQHPGLSIMNYHEPPLDEVFAHYLALTTPDVPIMLKNGENEIKIKLPSGKLSGKVISAINRKPLSGEWFTSYIQGKPPFCLQYDRPYTDRGFYEWFGVQALTDKNGAFTIRNIPNDTLTLADTYGEFYFGYGSEIISGPIKYDAKKPEKNIVLKMSEHGKLQISMIDSESGKSLRQMPVVLHTLTFYKVSDYFNFDKPIDLPPGKYVLWVRPDDGKHFSAKTTIQIVSRKLLHVIIKLVPAKQRIVFKAIKDGRFEDLAWPDKPATFFFGPADAPAKYLIDPSTDRDTKCRPWIGFTLSDAKTGKPVLRGPNGPEWGGYLPGFTFNREAVLPIKPGNYILDAVLRNTQNYSIKPHANLWRIHTKITVTAGKDTVITIK